MIEFPAAASATAGPTPGDEPGFDGPVVAIGASAGGLDALERLFGRLPAHTGAAFVVVQHLSPEHKSMMGNLLARHTTMPVREVQQDEALAADTVYLIPPGKTMRLARDRLQLAPKPERGLSLPIDIFFASLADAVGERALAVVLSGTGSDGSRGLAGIAAAGGYVFVQDPDDARFDGMPRSAIGTGLADCVAPIEALAERLAERLRHPSAAAPQPPGEAGDATPRPLDAILELLLASGGIDFRDYKPNTVMRRIERRMQVLHAGSLDPYLALLRASPEEAVLLRRELLIPVTRFFRDPEVFELLAEQVVPALVMREDPAPIRVWVACCATGEEAYSMAMLFAEAFARLGRSRPVKIFATDVEQHYLDQAAAGQYGDSVAAELGPERLARFFRECPGGHAVVPELRQMVIFARHNLVANPPFTRMDLVSCRNALIYLHPTAQEHALRRLQYALGVGGHLVLGPSESLGALHRDFRALAGGTKVFQLLRRDRLVGLRLSSQHRLAAGRGDAAPAGPAAPASPVDSALAHLMRAYTPPALLVGEGRELLHVYGDAGRLLQVPEGAPSLDVLKLLPREVAWAASSLLQAVAGERRVHRLAPLELAAAAGGRIALAAHPLESPDGRPLVLLAFEPAGAEAPAATAASLPAGQLAHIENLERELSQTHMSLQATVEELETSNEELQATNEELMASNEELQSTNEELQSVNEELYTVNAEYQEKVDILNAVNADLENMSRAAAIPTLFVDDSLALLRFTPETTQLFKLRESDVGRSLEDFAHRLDYPEFFADLRRTLADGAVVEREVRSAGGDWWLSRVQPYRDLSPGSPARAVVTFVNVTSLKDAQRLQAVIDSLPEHLAVMDAHGTITLVNAAWRRFAAENGDPTLAGCGPGANYLKTCAEAALDDDDARRSHEGLSAVLEGRSPAYTLQYPCHSRDRQRWFLMHAAPVLQPGGGAVVSHIDITAWVLARERENA